MTEQERIDIAYLDTGVYENPWRENLFETLPEDRKTAEVCRFAIKKSAFNIEFVPEAMKNAGTLSCRGRPPGRNTEIRP